MDESGSNPAMAQRYGCAPKGVRAEQKLPRNRGANTTLLAALTPKGLLEPMVVEGGTTIEVFLSYLRTLPLPGVACGPGGAPGQPARAQKPPGHRAH